MPYDEQLVHRLRELLASEERVTERKMFGGHAFMVRGHLCAAASRSGGLLVRVDPAESDEALARPHASLMEMRGRAVEGWVLVAAEGVRTKRQLEPWLRRSLRWIHTLPAK